MARLVLSVSRNNPITDLNLVVAVSLADTGVPVNGLKKSNFRFAILNYGSNALETLACTELQFPDGTPTGAYQLKLNTKPKLSPANPGSWLDLPLVIEVRQGRGREPNVGHLVTNVGLDLTAVD